MKQSKYVHLYVQLDENQITELKTIGKAHYGKASISSVAEKLLKEQCNKREITEECIYQENDLKK